MMHQNGAFRWIQVGEQLGSKNENIGNHRYIGTSILWIYRIYQRYIGGYFGTKYRSPKIDQKSWKCKKKLLEMDLEV